MVHLRAVLLRELSGRAIFDVTNLTACRMRSVAFGWARGGGRAVGVPLALFAFPTSEKTNKQRQVVGNLSRVIWGELPSGA